MNKKEKKSWAEDIFWYSIAKKVNCEVRLLSFVWGKLILFRILLLIMLITVTCLCCSVFESVPSQNYLRLVDSQKHSANFHVIPYVIKRYMYILRSVLSLYIDFIGAILQFTHSPTYVYIRCFKYSIIYGNDA